MAGSGRPYKVDPKVGSIRSEIQDGNFEIVKAILSEFGIDATDGDGRTTLINAVIENRLDFVVWLVENGANVNVQDRNGFSALHFTGQNRLVEISKFLLESGADPDLVDAHGNPPLWTAVFNSKMPDDDQGVVVNLMKFGANPNLKNRHGRSVAELYEGFHEADISSILM